MGLIKKSHLAAQSAMGYLRIQSVNSFGRFRLWDISSGNRDTLSPEELCGSMLVSVTNAVNTLVTVILQELSCMEQDRKKNYPDPILYNEDGRCGIILQ